MKNYNVALVEVLFGSPENVADVLDVARLYIRLHGDEREQEFYLERLGAELAVECDRDERRRFYRLKRGRERFNRAPGRTVTVW